MSTTDTGRLAEDAAAAFLERQRCKIVARNWRTRLCEIDIIARKKDNIYFCEVKYRRSIAQGGGLDYITSKKLEQMRFAAESWVHATAYDGDYQLCAIEVSGAGFAVTAFVEDL